MVQIPLDRLLLETDSPDGFEPLQRCSHALLQDDLLIQIPPEEPGVLPGLNQPANIRSHPQKVQFNRHSMMQDTVALKKVLLHSALFLAEGK